jgi:hypothetical protein
VAFYLQAAVFRKGYYDDVGLLHPVGQDLGGFQYNKGSGFTVCFEGKCILPLLKRRSPPGFPELFR